MFSTIDLTRSGMLILSLIGAIAYTYGARRNIKALTYFITASLTAYALVNVAFMVFLWFNHAPFPLNLEAMELTTLMHMKRAMIGLPIYPDPTPDFVALSYNPLYYFLAVPFAKVFGATLLTMRLVAILGMLGSGGVIFLAVRQGTGSGWWGALAVGLFAAAYRVMETYLDNAFPDSWMLFAALLGCYLVAQNRSQLWNLAGVLLAVTSFWFKQPGALLLAGVVLYLVWRDGWRKSWPSALVAAVLGPGLYWAAPAQLLGPRFHFFTWEVPRHWVELDVKNVLRVTQFLVSSYWVLGLVAGVSAVWTLLRLRRGANIWYAMLPIVALTAIPGLADPNSANNLYIPIGVWFIITGMLGLKQLVDRYPTARARGITVFALGASFALLVYNPMSVIVSSQASTSYVDMVSYLKSLDGPVYAPWLGQLQDGYVFTPSVHWVPMTDMIRGPGVDWQDQPEIRKLLASVMNPTGKAYILTNTPLEIDPALAFLSGKYVLDKNLGERFAPLTTLPKRYTLEWPRYLYRYDPRQVIK